MKLRAVAAVVAITFAMPLSAQIKTTGTLRPPAEAAPRAPQPEAPVPSRVLPEGTLLELTPRQEITSKRVEEGDRVMFATVGDVVEGDTVVIPRGSPVTGTIVWKTGRAIGGKSGKFEVRFDSVRVKGKTYSLSGTYRQEGRGNTVGALLGSIIISGRSAVMLPGQIVNGFTAEPIPYD